MDYLHENYMNKYIIKSQLHIAQGLGKIHIFPGIAMMTILLWCSAMMILWDGLDW